MTYLRVLFLGIILSLLIGCIESNQTFYINKNGTGKVVVETTFQVVDLLGGNIKPTKKQLDRKLRKNVKDILMKSKGVEVWKDVRYKYTKDGKIYFRGTAYFQDINNLNIQNASVMLMSLTKNNKNIILELKGNEKKKHNYPESGNGNKKLTEEEIQTEIEKQKKSYQQMKPMISMMLSSMKIKYIINTPGKIEKTVNFVKKNNTQIAFEFNGEKLLAVMDKMTSDEGWWRQQVLQGKNFKTDNPFNNNKVNKMMYGEEGPIQVIIKGDKNLFNYNKEVKSAKISYKRILKKLDI